MVRACMINCVGGSGFPVQPVKYMKMEEESAYDNGFEERDDSRKLGVERNYSTRIDFRSCRF